MTSTALITYQILRKWKQTDKERNYQRTYKGKYNNSNRLNPIGMDTQYKVPFP